MREYLLCLVSAAAVTYLATPVARILAVRSGALAEVRDRDIHDAPTPRWGGLAMAAGLLASVALGSQLPLMSAIFTDRRQISALLMSAAAIVVLGLIDDRFGLDAPTKLVGQVLAAALLAMQGVGVLWLPIGGTLVLDPISSLVVTVLIVLLSVNAVNMVDGLDGLAATIVGVGASAFFAYSYFLSVANGYQRAALATLVSAALVGMCAGFIPHNWFRARVFMGDTGSMLIGLLMAAATILLTGQLDPGSISGSALIPAFLPIILPLVILGVPLLDLLLAVVRRTKKGRSPFAPDKEHLHHRLLDLGHGQRRAVVIMGAATALVAYCAVSVVFVPPWVTMLAGILGLGGLALLVYRPKEAIDVDI